MTLYLDNLKEEDKRQETLKYLSELFLSMADVVTLTHIRLNYAQMLCLKDVKFRNKAIESKLLNLSALGSEMFVVKNFDILHTSTRETQHIQLKIR